MIGITAIDPPRRIRPEDLVDRYGVTKRQAGELLRAMIAAGVVRKPGGKLIMGRLSACDEWIVTGKDELAQKRAAKGPR